MKKSNLRKITLVLILTIILTMVTLNVYATGTSDNPLVPTIPSINGGNNNGNNSNTIENPSDNTNLIPPTTTTNTTTNTISNYTNNTSLPQTGDASDYAIFMLIAVAILIAVYAYKKSRDYKNI